MEQGKQEYLNISPISKGKRMLLYLADFFLNFFIAFFLFNLIAMPVGRAISQADKKQLESDTAAEVQFNILYGNQVMLYENQKMKFQYNACAEFTKNCYLSYYSLNDTDVLEKHPQFGKHEENEVIRHFFYDIRNNKQNYLDLVKSFNTHYEYFVIEDDSVRFTDEIKEQMRVYFLSNKDISKDGKEIFSHLETFFFQCYTAVFKDIEKNDLLFNNTSYIENKNIVARVERYYKMRVFISALSTYTLSCVIYFMIIPLISKNGKTPAMMMMRLERIGTNNLYLLNKGEVAINFVYAFVFFIASAFFLPIFYTGFDYLFNISYLASLLLIGLLAVIVSFIFILVSSYSRSLTDFLSRSVIIKTDDLNAIYRSKGYDI